MRGVIHQFFFFFNDTATPEIYTLSLHDALPIWWDTAAGRSSGDWQIALPWGAPGGTALRRDARRGVRGPSRASSRRSAADNARLDEAVRSEEHTSELQSQSNLVCRLLLEKKNTN